MLGIALRADRDGVAIGIRWVGVLAVLSFGCPGVEPSETGTGAGSGGEGGRASTTSSSGKGQGGGSSSSDTSSSGTNMGGDGGEGGGCNADLSTDVENCGECGRACVKDENVETPRCVDGVCQSFCKSGFVNITQPETGPDDGCEAPGRRAFVTEDSMTLQQIGGVAGADMRCQTIADSQKLGGEWRAWLSEEANTNAVAERFETQPAAPYMLLDFTLLADSFAQLTTDLALDHPIDLTESLTPVMATAVWTGTTPAGLASGLDCNGWTTQNGEVTIGDAAAFTEEWTQQETSGSCADTAQLYCFEQ